MAATSIYDTLTCPPAPRCAEARTRARRLRSERVCGVDARWAERQAWQEALRRRYAGAKDPTDVLRAAVTRLNRDVCALESSVAARAPAARREPVAIRAALELLRRYAQRLAADWSWLDVDDRELWRELLSLEHRACYAAAGTTRADFEAAVGRTGAR